MGRVAHSRLDELRKCAQPMSWMDDDEVIDVLNELWSARETINDVSAKLIQDERQLAAQAAEIERLTQNRDYWHEQCLVAWEHRDGANAQVANLDAELTALRAQLAAANAEAERQQRRADKYVNEILVVVSKLNESRERCAALLKQRPSLVAKVVRELVEEHAKEIAYWMHVRNLAWEHRDNANDQVAELEVELAALRSQLEEQRANLEATEPNH